MIKIKIRIIICIVLTLLCFFLLGTIVIIKINDLLGSYETITKEWLNLQSSDGNYAVKVVSVIDVYYYAFSSNTFRTYNLDIYIKEENSDRPEKYYFSTKIGPIKHGLKDENYEIEWIDNGAILKFKDHRKSKSFLLDFEEFFSEISE